MEEIQTIKRLSKLGICGIISLLSYTAMVVFSPLAYPGYNWMSMAVSELSAAGAPSKELAGQLNALFGPCALVSVMAVCIVVAGSKSKLFRIGIYLFALMEWCCNVGYECFPWVSDENTLAFQNIMHIAVTVAVVVLSIVSLLVIAIGAKKDNRKTIEVWAIISLAAMLGGAIGTHILPQMLFGIAERISTFSVVVFNAVLGIELLRGSLNDNQHEKNNRKKFRGNYPMLNGDRDTANMLVTLPDSSKGWTDGLGNGYIR